MLKRFEKNLPQCRAVQNRLLLSILRANQTSDFGRKHHFEQVGNYLEYRQALPLSNYAYFAPYIERCREGDAKALFGAGQEILMFALTSGTTARAKLIPVTRQFAQGYRRGWEIWGFKAITDHPDSYLRKILQVSSPADEVRTPAGIPCGAISGLLARDQKRIIRQFYATPYEVTRIENPADRYYAVMRFAIAEDIGFISTANPSTTLILARTAQENAERLIRNLHDGTLDESISMPKPLRQQLTRHLRADASRAEELEELLKRHGRLLPQHYWNISFLANWTGGSLGFYLPRLSEYFGVAPIRDIGLLASEGRISIPLWDNTPAGVLDITNNFYEFVPQKEIERLDDPEKTDTLEGYFRVMPGWELEKGKAYYIFLTNRAGLYRYNLGDLVRVTGHMGTTPIIEFLSKGAHNSSVTGEKLTESQVVEAVRTSADELAIALENFVMAPQWSDPPRYRLFLAPRHKLEKNDLKRLAGRVDQRLSAINLEYESKRRSNRLARIRVQQVPAQFLARHEENRRRQNQGRSEQFKHRYLYNKPLEFEK
ncbi:MAG: hypothetical protein AMJ79_04410 [Phycisphaerae bacterium SM23_30]|nr:MAG: hypothetical protein AMJ79_04410 [Phycisphaerae bacterium SM23_30]